MSSTSRSAARRRAAGGSRLPGRRFRAVGDKVPRALSTPGGWSVHARAIKGILDERHLGLVSAGALFFVGAEMLTTDAATERSWANVAGYILLSLLAAAGLVGYVRTRYVGVLAVGVIALATVVPQAVIDYTDGALGAAGALLLIGLSIVGASLVGVRLRSTSRHKDRPDPGIDRRADLR